MIVEHEGPYIKDLEWGNAEASASQGRYWIVGHSAETALRTMPEHAKAQSICMKWRAHLAGDPEGKGKPKSQGNTISMLTNDGGAIRLRFWANSKDDATTLLLDKRGDFAVWGEGIYHEWEVERPSNVVTMRWTPG